MKTVARTGAYTNTGRIVSLRGGVQPNWCGFGHGDRSYSIRLHRLDPEYVPVAAIVNVLDSPRVRQEAGGWAVVIEGEVVETFPTKTDAQVAVEDLLGLR